MCSERASKQRSKNTSKRKGNAARQVTKKRTLKKQISVCAFEYQVFSQRLFKRRDERK